MSQKPYGMICPITRACDILEPRWTIPILVALWAGCTKFNDIRREIGNISPGLLSRRLKDLEKLNLVERIEDPASGSVDYVRSEMAAGLEPVLNGMAKWAQTFIEAEVALCSVDISTLMWKMRQCIRVEELPDRRIVLQFRFDAPGQEYDTYWVVACRTGAIEVCCSTPGFEVDLFIETNVISLGGILLGRTTISRELDRGDLYVSGDALIARTMERWLKVSDYAKFDGVRMLPDTRRSPMRPQERQAV